MARDAVLAARKERNAALVEAMILAASADGSIASREMETLIRRVIERPEFEGTKPEELNALIESSAAVVAEAGAEMIFVAAARAVIAKLARRHGEEEALGTFDELDVADDESVIEGERAKRLETPGGVAAEVDADFSQLHGDTPKL
jgi:hypothetical protein